MSATITATMLYNLEQCPHRVTMDLFGDPAERAAVSPFVHLLWERGHLFERDVIQALEIPFTDLKAHPDADRERLTSEAMTRGDGLIYGGRIVAGDLVGEPDLLRRQTEGYVAGDIKSAAGEEAATEGTGGRLKRHYAVQLALYTDVLRRLGLSGGHTPFIWDIHGEEVEYDLDALQGKRDPTTLWADYQCSLAVARAIAEGRAGTRPAHSGICKLCPWRRVCTAQLEASDDLTLIPELGRAKRDAMVEYFGTRRDLAGADIQTLTHGKKTAMPGIGPESLARFQERARLQIRPGAHPYLTEHLTLPSSDAELFFDIEDDPFRDLCYLHGFLERRNGNSPAERYVAFFVGHPGPEEEERVFAEAWAYVKASRPCAIYYYSHHERTVWRKLQRRFPRVAEEAEIQEMFDAPSTVDLYSDIVRSKSIWPTRDHSIKTLAQHIGFTWRDDEPSGTASIEWYHRWVESGDASIRQRILEYNEDDCAAMRALLDSLSTLSVVST